MSAILARKGPRIRDQSSLVQVLKQSPRWRKGKDVRHAYKMRATNNKIQLLSPTLYKTDHASATSSGPAHTQSGGLSPNKCLETCRSSTSYSAFSWSGTHLTEPLAASAFPARTHADLDVPTCSLPRHRAQGYCYRTNPAGAS